jgi:hypothetical protein
MAVETELPDAVSTARLTHSSATVRLWDYETQLAKLEQARRRHPAWNDPARADELIDLDQQIATTRRQIAIQQEIAARADEARRIVEADRIAANARATVTDAERQYAAILQRALDAATVLVECAADLDIVHARFRQARRTLGIRDGWRPLPLPTVPYGWRARAKDDIARFSGSSQEPTDGPQPD